MHFRPSASWHPTHTCCGKGKWSISRKTVPIFHLSGRRMHYSVDKCHMLTVKTLQHDYKMLQASEIHSKTWCYWAEQHILSPLLPIPSWQCHWVMPWRCTSSYCHQPLLLPEMLYTQQSECKDLRQALCPMHSGGKILWTDYEVTLLFHTQNLSITLRSSMNSMHYCQLP